MLSRAQQILLKRAQQEAGLDDTDYRDALETISAIPGCRSSKDKRLTDRHVDNLLSWFEAIFWRAVDAGALQPSGKPNAIFRQRGFWAGRNPSGNTSRDRYTESEITTAITALESELTHLGLGAAYFAAIKRNIQPFSHVIYKAALTRTLASKSKAIEQPF